MAIDRTGISSLNAGAPDINYTGNQGPKSPEQERQMAFDDTPGFELQPLELLIDEFRQDNNGQDPQSIDDLRKYFYNKYGPKGIAKVEQAVQQSQQSQQMASADPILQDEYDQDVFDLQENNPGARPMSIEQFREQAISGMAYGGTARPTYTQSRKQRINAAGGGIMGSNAGSMLVAPTADGSRPGYAWWNPMDWIPNEIKDPIAKIIPNELKNPAVAAIAANYLPSLIPGGDATLLQKGKRLISQLGTAEDMTKKAIMPLNYAPQNPSFDEQYEDIEDIIAGQPGKLGTGPITINKPAPRLTDIIPEGTGTTGEGWLYNLGQGAKDLAEGLGGTIGAGVGALGSGIGA